MQVVQPKPTRLNPSWSRYGLQAGLLEIGRDDLRSGRQRGLDPRLALQAALDGVAGEEARSDQHARIRRVRATRDRGDDDVAMPDVERLAFDRTRLASSPGFLYSVVSAVCEAALDVGQRDAAFGPLRAGHRRHDVAEIERQRIGEDRVGGSGSR